MIAKLERKKVLQTKQRPNTKKASEYDQEMPQSHIIDQPTAPRGRAKDH